MRVHDSSSSSSSNISREPPERSETRRNGWTRNVHGGSTRAGHRWGSPPQAATHRTAATRSQRYLAGQYCDLDGGRKESYILGQRRNELWDCNNEMMTTTSSIERDSNQMVAIKQTAVEAWISVPAGNDAEGDG